MKRLFVALLLGTSSIFCSAQQTLTSVASIDLPRYLGTWFEIAKYPNRFQKMCASNTSAHYSVQPDGSLRVRNRCSEADGKVSQVEGRALQIGAATSAKLEVRFAPAWLSFLPFVWGDYWVIDLDPDYQLAAVSEPKREYLWILSRTPSVSAKAYDELLARLRAKSLDTSKLERTWHGQ